MAPQLVSAVPRRATGHSLEPLAYGMLCISSKITLAGAYIHRELSELETVIIDHCRISPHSLTAYYHVGWYHKITSLGGNHNCRDIMETHISILGVL